MPRFVLLEHDHPHLHWDLMLEAGGALRTWRLTAPPRAGVPSAAEALGRHRIAYLDYEGLVSGGRGQVKRWDAGAFSWEVDSDARIVVRLEGERCRGRAELTCRGDADWELTFLPDL
jgi:hypothetical protein